jgi:hypothetical protein
VSPTGPAGCLVVSGVLRDRTFAAQPPGPSHHRATVRDLDADLRARRVVSPPRVSVDPLAAGAVFTRLGVVAAGVPSPLVRGPDGPAPLTYTGLIVVAGPKRPWRAALRTIVAGGGMLLPAAVRREPYGCSTTTSWAAAPGRCGHAPAADRLVAPLDRTVDPPAHPEGQRPGFSSSSSLTRTPTPRVNPETLMRRESRRHSEQPPVSRSRRDLRPGASSR